MSAHFESLNSNEGEAGEVGSSDSSGSSTIQSEEESENIIEPEKEESRDQN
jgi:hypothetical protein